MNFLGQYRPLRQTVLFVFLLKSTIMPYYFVRVFFTCFLSKCQPDCLISFIYITFNETNTIYIYIYIFIFINKQLMNKLWIQTLYMDICTLKSSIHLSVIFEGMGIQKLLLSYVCGSCQANGHNLWTFHISYTNKWSHTAFNRRGTQQQITPLL